ncbi:carbohydrate ABC transporter substrate-binding protein (CUT1 family) [Phyllobacterium myrsinacearum]|uniref:ABC transporter substrate-binding protein n=1 Tax=Phyllobacterium myrsinacearum TaxID=28101 RepID=UPI00102A9A1D|nr:sugar ABC transporter substrate-binding protein [Phyllobacterium myrsinacearum]RZS79340.1 carbohydrate ABC transporter substrate-binding protein (CUT1 family) [Phyllobacterium myrsinacearum]
MLRTSYCTALVSGVSLLVFANVANAQICTSTVRVLAQPRDSLTLLESYKDEFKKLSGASFEFDYLNENDRRAKSRAEAATTGKYNVYYIDEANVALFAESKWIVPLLEYYPADASYDDFDAGRKKVASYNGVAYFAPIQGGGDLLYYRKDVLEKAGITPPKTLDEYEAALAKLNDPAKGFYGTALRGGRGSGANVWRWMTYFKAFGGQWFVDGKPTFNSDAAVKATETYLRLFQYSAPGTQTGSWTEVTEAFNSGNVAMIIESSPLAGQTEDPKQSSVAGKVGYTVPPRPLVGGGYGHGLAIGAKANADDAARKCVGAFIAWATSKQNEERRLERGIFGDINRTSVINSDAFKQKYGAEIGNALNETAQYTDVNFWVNADWPDLGDRWGIILEELITGTRTDIKGGLDELEAYANKLIARR